MGTAPAESELIFTTRTNTHKDPDQIILSIECVCHNHGDAAGDGRVSQGTSSGVYLYALNRALLG